MKVFEKIWANRNKNQGGFGMKWLGKELWRAALEWVLAKHHEDRDELEGVVFRELEEK